jgi:GNAT superfamily N-acetyltransferase
VPFTVIRYTERPELWENTAAISEEVWPEYNRHGEVLGRYWERLFDEFTEYQFALHDGEAQEVIAEGHTVPCDWDGTTGGLGDGIDAMMAAAFEARAGGRAPTALCALAAEVRPRFQGGGVADRMLDVMSDLARDGGLRNLIAPVRPSRKDRYPITPIEHYVAWTRDNEEPFDPWIRAHVGALDRDAVPERRGVHVPGRAGARRDRPRPRPWLLLGAERLDRPCTERAAAWPRPGPDGPAWTHGCREAAPALMTRDESCARSRS